MENGNHDHGKWHIYYRIHSKKLVEILEVLSDLIVIWRAWVLFPDRQWIILIPFIMWIGAVGEQTFSVQLRLFADTYTLPGVNTGNLVWLSLPNDYVQLYSNVENSLTAASNGLSMATNAVTTLMITYKLWCVVLLNGIHWTWWLTMKWYCRCHRKFLGKTLGSSRRKSPVQTVLILLVESGFVYLGFQVSDFKICAHIISPYDRQRTWF